MKALPAAPVPTVLAVGAVAEVLGWLVLSADAGRTAHELLFEHEADAAIVAVSLGVVGAVVLRRLPRHLLGWLFVAIAQCEGLSLLATAYAAGPPGRPLASLAVWVGGLVWLPGMLAATALLTPLFPDGRPPSPRWKPLVWAGVVCVVVATGGMAWSDQLVPGNPLAAAAGSARGLALAIASAAALGAFVCGAIGGVLLIVRMVRRPGAERWRIAWFFGGLLAVIVTSLLPLGPAVQLAGTTVLPLAIGVAIVRHNPHAALADLGRRLSAAVAPEDVLRIVANTVRTALGVPRASVVLAEPRDTDDVNVPIWHAGERVATLVVGLPPGQRRLDPADEQLLTDFARQAGPAVHAVRLARDLRDSRDRLAVARAEERHRIRRDLHDQLGPALAGIALGLGAATRAVRQGDPHPTELLEHLQIEVHDSLRDVKRLIADLTPTTLHERGLLDALTQYAEGMSARSDGALSVSVEADGPLDDLPEPVAVAAYRIVLEAVTNTARHANASVCAVRLSMAGERLELTVADDGRGLPVDPRPGDLGPPVDARSGGLGLRSMAERAAELGGCCTIAAAVPRGTLVTASLPVRRP